MKSGINFYSTTSRGTITLVLSNGDDHVNILQSDEPVNDCWFMIGVLQVIQLDDFKLF
jgi:hypothetical protein